MNRVITNDVTYYINVVVRIAHNICNHPLLIYFLCISRCMDHTNDHTEDNRYSNTGIFSDHAQKCV